MNSLILKNSSGLITDPHILGHLHATLKAEVGDVLKCTVLNQGLTTGKIVELSETHCQLALSPSQEGARQWFNLVVGLSRPQTSKKVLEHATTFGAQNIHFFKAALSEKSYLDSKVFEQNEREEYMLAGLSQSTIYAHMPTFKLDKFNPAANYNEEGQKFILDLNATKSFLGYEIDFSKPVTLAVGPERGFIPEDISRFHDAGFKSVTISSSVLRVEHAVYSAISQLELLKGPLVVRNLL
jgi:16S rRNA (uracil1498-N3)-methyltransferase